MSTSEILTLIDTEIATLKQARALIAAVAPATDMRKPGRPAKAFAVAAVRGRKKRMMSPEGRARLVAAVKARWARQKKKTAAS